MRIDNEQLLAARAGDTCALECVLRHSRQDLRRYAEHHCNVNDVEDAVQESLILVSRNLTGLRALEAFASWLFRIVKRECNRLKRVRRQALAQPITEEIEGPHPPGRNELLHDVAKVMARLPAHYRQILLWRDLEGIGMDEIAQRLDLHKEAAKARLHRARALARHYFSHSIQV